MKAGIHKNVKIVGCYVGESNEKKTPYFAIEWQNDQQEYIDSLHWLNDTSKDGNKSPRERSLETLINIGFKGKSLADLSDPSKKLNDIFDTVSDHINLTVEDETYANDKGESRTKQVVKWVNVGSGGMPRFDHKTAVVKFKALSIDGDLMKLRKEIAAPKVKSPEVAVEKQAADINSEDIPF